MIPGETTPNSFILEGNSGAAAELTGDGSSATAEITTKGDDWNVKFYAVTGLSLEAGKTYKISFDLSGASGVPVCYKNGGNGNEEGFGAETADAGTVEHQVTPSEGGKLEIMLKIGNVPQDTEVTVSDIKVEKLGSEFSEVELSGFAYPVTQMTLGNTTANSFFLESNSGADASLTGDGDSATATVNVNGSDWNIKFYALTGLTLDAGKTYKISFKLSGASGVPVFYKNNTTGKEEGFGSKTADAGTVEHEVTPSDAGGLEIMLKLGAFPVGTEVTVSDIAVY